MTDEDDSNAVPVRQIIEKYNKLARLDASAKVDIRDEREKLLARLRSSRDELDTYIRHTKKVCDEKRSIERENNSLKTQLKDYEEKVAKLEKLEQTLRVEFSRLWHLIKDPKFSTSDETLDYEVVTSSISQILDPETVEKSNDFFNELNRLKKEIIEKQRTIDKLDNEINHLNSQKTDALSPSHTPETVLNESKVETSAQINELKNYMKNLYMKEIVHLKEMNDNLEIKRLCTIDKEMDLSDMVKFSENLQETPLAEMEISILTDELMKMMQTSSDNLLSQIEYLDKKAYEFFQANESLSDEVNQLKYALNHRIQIQQYQQVTSREPCNCATEKIKPLEEEIEKLKNALTIKDIELEALYEEKYELIKIMAEMNTDDSHYTHDVVVQPSNDAVDGS